MNDDKKTKRRKPASWWNRQAKDDPNKMFWFYTDDAMRLGVVDYIGLPEIKVVEKETKYKIKIRKKG